LSSRTSPSIPKSAIETLSALKVFVSMMSAPASRYARWMSRTISGRTRFSASLFVLEVDRVVRKPLAAVVRLLQLVTLDHRPHRAVDDEDALLEKVADLLFNAHRDCSPDARQGIHPFIRI
jgi:hypothetical protein